MDRERRAEKRARGAEHRRRVTTQLAQLAWLEGFPLGGGWYRMDRDEPIALDGALIARARRAARTALREHRAALADAVGDVERWWEIVDTTLAWCSAPHGELDLLRYVPRRVAAQAEALMARPGLGPAVIAAGVAWVTRPAQLAQVLDWLAGHGAIVEDVPTTLVLARWAAESPDGVTALIELLAIDAPDPRTATAYVDSLRKRLLDDQHELTAPAARTGPEVRDWLAVLRRRDPEVRRRALDLLAVSRIAEALAPWCEWERASAEPLARAAAFVARRPHPDEPIRNQQRVLKRVGDIKLAVPAMAIGVGNALAAMDHLADDALRDSHGAMVRLLAAFARDAIGAPTQALHHLVSITGFGDRRRLTWLWDALVAARDAGAPARLFAPWDAVLHTREHAYMERSLEGLSRRADIERLVGALALLAERRAMTAGDVRCAGAWIAAGLPAHTAADVVDALRADGGELDVAVARAAIALSDGSVAGIVASLAPVRLAIANLEDAHREAVLPLIRQAAKGGAGWLIRAAIAGGQARQLAVAAHAFTAIRATRWPALASQLADPPAWIVRYPDSLHAALGRLAAVDPDAKHTAARRLASDLPDPGELRREIAALEARPSRTASQAQRLANLRERLAAPRLPSQGRLVRLADKLDRAAAAIGVQRFVDRATAAVTERLARVFPDGGWPDLGDLRMRELVFGLLALSEPDRALAGRLFAARTGPPPWDLRDDRANRGFIAAMQDAGLDPAPWLDDTPVTVEASDGEPLELALCSDPVEVFAMGAHFSTCLSPGSTNYFSVLANAADINKRVLYGRRAGRVVARCLLAVTDEHTVLIFHPYCHDAAIDFAAHVASYARDLATRMGTRVAPRGTVRLLVARGWYDDGPVDLVGQFGALDDAALDLAHIDPGALVDRLRRALGHELDDITLPMVLDLRSLRQRPALLVPLAPYIEATRSAATHITAAQIAADAGDLALADRLLGNHAGAIRIDDYPWPGGALLAQLRPSTALARLRATRPRGVRSWRDERDERLAVAAMAMAALHRPHKAAELYQLAIDTGSYLTDELAPRLAALRDHLG